MAAKNRTQVRPVVLRLSPALLVCAALAGCETTETLPDDPYNPRIETVRTAATVPTTDKTSAMGPGLVMAPGQLMKIHSLNVGAGSCHVVECPGPGNEKLVLDCGTVGRTTTSMEEAELAAFGTQVFGANSSITVITSHPDRDHYIFVDDLVGTRNVQSVWLGGDSTKYTTDDFIDWLEAKQTQGAPVFHELPVGFANAGVPVSELSCGLASVWILTANVGNSKNANSIGVLIYYDGFKALLPGDAEGVTQESMTANFGALTRDVDLLLASHHGSRSHRSNRSPWPEHVNPQIVVYSSGDEFKHPRCSIVGNYRPNLMDAATHPVWCDPIDDSSNNVTTDVDFAEYVTEVNGIVEVETDGDTVSISCSNHPGGCF